MRPEVFFEQHAKLTRSLKKFLSDQQALHEPLVFENFLEMLSEEINKVKAQLMLLPAGALRARKVQELVDAEIVQENTIPVSCFKGCSHCCHMEVEITSFEAEILKDIVQSGFAVDSARLQLQAQRPLQDPAWRELGRRSENRCVFLAEDGACSIYDSRPVMCRRHSVTSPAKHCESLDEVITLRYFPKVDLIISAANEDPELRIGPLAKMLA